MPNCIYIHGGQRLLGSMTPEEIKQMNDNTKELIRLMKVMQEVCK